MSKTSAIINNRPLSVDTINDPLSPNPLTPNHLLTIKSKIILPPPGNFQCNDLYSRKRWRRVQHLVNKFWSRWKVEFLLNLQIRQKWTAPKRNMSVGDIVILKDDNLPRSKWRLGPVDDMTQDLDGFVRKVRVAMSSSLNNNGEHNSLIMYLDPLVNKFILLKETQDVGTSVMCI